MAQTRILFSRNDGHTCTPVDFSGSPQEVTWSLIIEELRPLYPDLFHVSGKKLCRMFWKRVDGTKVEIVDDLSLQNAVEGMKDRKMGLKKMTPKNSPLHAIYLEQHFLSKVYALFHKTPKRSTAGFNCRNENPLCDEKVV